MVCTPLYTRRYLVPASLTGGSLRSIRNLDYCPHIHHGTAFHKMVRVPMSADWPRPPAALVAGSGASSGHGERATAALSVPIEVDPAPLGWGSSRPWRMGPEERERFMGRVRGKNHRREERDSWKGLADPGAHHHLILHQLDGRV